MSPLLLALLFICATTAQLTSPVVGAVSAPSDNGLVIGSYNILGWYHDEGRVREKGNFAPDRLGQIAKNIAQVMKYDIVGIQEYKEPTSGDKRSLEHAVQKLNPSYKVLYSDQLPIIYDSSKVQVVDSWTTRPSSGLRAIVMPRGGSAFIHVARFSIIGSSQEVQVLNNHLCTKCHGNGYYGAQIRVNTLKLAINDPKVKSFSGAVYSVGDYNSSRSRSRDRRVFEYMSSVGYVDAYEKATTKNGKPSIDHIFYKESGSIVSPPSYTTLDCTRISPSNPKNYKHSANACASDHRPVGTTSSVTTSGDCVGSIDDPRYNEYSIGYFGRECVCPETGIQVGDNKDYAGNQILTDEQLQKVSENQPFYEASAKKENIPWQIIAVIHLRESSLSRTGPGNGQGPYQDYERNAVPTSLRRGGSWKVGAYSDQEFQTATDWIAEHIKNKYSLNPDKLSSDNNEVKNLFFRYNGQAGVYKRQATALGFNGKTEGYEGSPYVVNRIDLKRDPTVEPTKSNRTWGQIKTDGGSISYPANSDYGAFVTYLALGGRTNGGTTLSMQPNGCVDTASDGSAEKLQELAKAYTQDWKTSTTLSQTDAYKTAVSKSKYQSACTGNDCGSFVYILMHESGWDTNYGGNSGQSDHMRTWFSDPGNGWSAVPDMKDVSPATISVSKLLPGDVLWYSGHVYVFVGDIFKDGKQYFASASNCKRSPAYHTGIDTYGSSTTVYRKSKGQVM